MDKGSMIIITGCPGTGKTTAAARVAAQTEGARSVHMHTDDFYHFLSKGALPPHLPGADEQNLAVIEAFLAAALRFIRSGYDVVVDGIVGPWFLDPFLRAAREGCAVHYIVLRANREETLRRAVGRSKLGREANFEVVEAMWPQFACLGRWEANALDTTALTLDETVAAIKARVRSGACRL